MAQYSSYSQAWLDDPTAIRIVLAIVTVNSLVESNPTKKLYFSNSGYVTTDGSISFDPVIRRSVTLTETLTADGGGNMGFGDLELDNQMGTYDDYLDSTKYIWSNRFVQIYYGDAQWTCATEADIATKFSLIFDGTIDDIGSRNRTSINIRFRDKLERLNMPLTENKLGTTGTWSGGQTNQDTIRPLIFGEVFNVEPLMTNPAYLYYMINDGGFEQLIEVRDNGYPIYNSSKSSGASTTTAVGAPAFASTSSGTTGSFRLTSPAAGTITFSAQGVNNSINLSTGALVTGTYKNSVANIIALIVTQYGNASNRLSASDLDLTNLLAFDTANTQNVGIRVTDTTTVLAVIRALAGSIGSQVFFNRAGKLQILKYGPTSGFVNSNISAITENDILYDTMSVSDRIPVIGAVKIGYAKNYTLQSNLSTAIPQEHKDSMSTEWYTKTKVDTSNVNNYKLSTDATQIDTYLINDTEADTEAQRRLDLFKTQRMVYSFRGATPLLGLQLGQTVTLTHSRFGLKSGKSGQVISLNPDFTLGTVEVGVLI